MPHSVPSLALWRRLACLAVPAVLAGALAACGSSSSSNTTAASKTSGKSITIAGVPGDPTDAFFTAMKCAAQSAASAAGAKLTWQAPATPDVPAESTLLRTIETTKPGGILLEALSGTALSSQVQSLMQQGIPVAIVDSPITPPVGYQVFHTDNAATGKLVAASVSKLLGGSGKVAIITKSVGSPTETQRYKSFVTALKAYPNIKVVAVEYANANSATAAQHASSLMAAHPDLSLIYATDGPAAAGTASAIAGQHKTGKVKLIAFDAEPVQVQAVREGKITGLVAQSPYLMAQGAVKALLNQAKQGTSGPVKPLPAAQQDVVTPFMFLTKDNLDSPRAKKFFEYPASC